MKKLTVPRRLSSGTMLVEFDTLGTGQIMQATDIEFVFIDIEHSGFEYESLKRTLRYLQSAELASFARVPSSHYDHIARALHGEARRYDFVAELSQITCPMLLLTGERDPITPVADAEDIGAALPPELIRFECFAHCGHDVQRDGPDGTEQVLRAFTPS
jgi:pimeloyl-ACP methyl ester carboxylesterase